MPRLAFYGANAQAYNSREPEILLAGPAGTGKSVAYLAKCLTLLDKYPGTRGLFCRGTRASLTQSGLVTWERDVLGFSHPVLVKNPIKRRVRQSYEFPNQSELVVAGLDDPGKALSTDYDFIYIMEATEEGVDLDVYETLTGRLRTGAMPWQQVMMDCNPTTPAHWLHKRYKAGKLTLYSSTHKDNPRYWDRARREWTPAGLAYVRGRLERLTGTRRKRFLEGVWAMAEGLIYDGFSPDVHLLPARWRPPVGWPVVWGLDWGWTSPSVLAFCAVDPDGRMYFYRELYKPGERAAEMARWAADEIQVGREPVPTAIVCDHDEKMAAEFEAALPPQCPRLALADKKDELAGIQAMQGRFDLAGDGRPRVFFAPDALAHRPDQGLADAGEPTCGLEEIGAWAWDKTRVTDTPENRRNHFCDPMRYIMRWVDANLVPYLGESRYSYDDTADALPPHLR
jgi:phage terminase large subunit